MAEGVKEAYTRMEAMPGFQSAEVKKQIRADMPAELAKWQPLDPALGALRDSIRVNLRSLGQKLDELRECVVALEDRQRRMRSNEGEVSFGTPPQNQALALYGAINAQSAIIQAQAVKLEEVAAAIKGAGLMREASLDLEAWAGEIGKLKYILFELKRVGFLFC